MGISRLSAAVVLSACVTGMALAQPTSANDKPALVAPVDGDSVDLLPPPPEVIFPEMPHMDGAYSLNTSGVSRPRLALDPTILGNMLSGFYPQASRRHNETGSAVLVMCVDDKGWAKQISVMRSSGFERLDDASLMFMSRVPMKPAQLAGKPVAVCGYVFAVDWMLTDPPAEQPQ